MRVTFERVGTRGGGGSRLKAIHGTNIGDNLPDLILRNAAAPGGHPVGSALYDCVEKICGFAAVNPVLLNQRRPDASAPVRMATGTIKPIEKPLSFGNIIGGCVVRIVHDNFASDRSSRTQCALSRCV